MKFERGVVCEKGAVKKKPVFSSTTIAGRKRAFSLYNSRWCRRLGKFGREAEAGYACSPFEVYCLSENRENLSRPLRRRSEEERVCAFSLSLVPLETYYRPI
jgi:hypothetical protein